MSHQEPIGYVLKQVQHALRATMDEKLRPHGLTTPQYSALSALAASGDLSGAELARHGFVTPQTMHGIVLNLEAAGLVSRRADPADARALVVALTPAGQMLLDTCQQAVEAIEEQMLSGLQPEERPWLLDALHRCAAALSTPGT